MPFTQDFAPLDESSLASAGIVLIPILTLFALLFVTKVIYAAIVGLAVILVVACVLFKLPVDLAFMSALTGFLYGAWPICLIIFAAIFLYDLCVVTGHFDVVKFSIASTTRDKRCLALLLSYCFGGFIEGASGFSTPIALATAMMIGLGFDKVEAAKASLIANSVPVAFGGMGIPVTTLGSITGIDSQDLAIAITRLLIPLSLLQPFVIVYCVSPSFLSSLEVWPLSLLVGVLQTGLFLLFSEFVGPSVPTIISFLITMGAVVVFLRFWQPKNVLMTAQMQAEESLRLSSEGSNLAKTIEQPIQLAAPLSIEAECTASKILSTPSVGLEHENASLMRMSPNAVSALSRDSTTVLCGEPTSPKQATNHVFEESPAVVNDLVSESTSVSEKLKRTATALLMKPLEYAPVSTILTTQSKLPGASYQETPPSLVLSGCKEMGTTPSCVTSEVVVSSVGRPELFSTEVGRSALDASIGAVPVDCPDEEEEEAFESGVLTPPSSPVVSSPIAENTSITTTAMATPWALHPAAAGTLRIRRIPPRPQTLAAVDISSPNFALLPQLSEALMARFGVGIVKTAARERLLGEEVVVAAETKVPGSMAEADSGTEKNMETTAEQAKLAEVGVKLTDITISDKSTTEKKQEKPVDDGHGGAAPTAEVIHHFDHFHPPTSAQMLLAWLPWLLVCVTVSIWGEASVKRGLDVATVKAHLHPLDRAVFRPSPSAAQAGSLMEAVWKLDFLGATGVCLLLNGVITGVLYRVRVRKFLRVAVHSFSRMSISFLTICILLAFGYVLRYSGADSTLGLAAAQSGDGFPFVGALIGFLGVALTGSATTNNVIFGNLQVVAAGQLGLSKLGMAAANTVAGQIGHILSTSSMVVASVSAGSGKDISGIAKSVAGYALVEIILFGCWNLIVAHLLPGFLPSDK